MKHLKQWHIKIRGREEGPYSFWDLKADPRVTPETLAWKKGMVGWVPIRMIPELEELFQEGIFPPLKPGEEAILSMERSPKEQFLWVVALILTLALVFYLFML